MILQQSIKTFLVVLFGTMCNVLVAQDESPSGREDWRGHIEMARKAYKDGQFNAAMLHYKNAQSSLPSSVDIQEELAQTKFRLNEIEEAEKSYKDLLEGNKMQRARAEHNLGNINMKRKAYQDAIKHYTNSLKLNAKNEEAKYNLSQAIRKLKEAQQKPQPQNGPQPPQPQKPQEDKNQGEDGEDGQLPEETLKKMLKDLLKQEAETKRKLNQGSGNRRPLNTVKDW